MEKSYRFMRPWHWLGLALTLVCQVASAQITISFPYARVILQRNQLNEAAVPIVGYYSLPLDRVEVRFLPVREDMGVETDWLPVNHIPEQGAIRGRVTVKGGWYRMEIRGLRDGQVLDQRAIDRVGVGEVFLVAGQSNAAGVEMLGSRGASERVNSFNAYNRFLNNDNMIVSSEKPFPMPTFSPLRAENRIFPTGEAAWCWGELGDKIADRFGVPVLFFNVGLPASVVRNWSETANGQLSQNIFLSKPWPNFQPYRNLRNALIYYHSVFGIRAVLWHQGESDAVPLKTPQEVYRAQLQSVISRSREDLGRNISWVVARTSLTPETNQSSQPILFAQNDVINRAGNNVFAGPYTDTIQVPRQVHGHFENIRTGVQGISQLAEAWNQSLSDGFFLQSQPQQATRLFATAPLPRRIPVGGEVLVSFDWLGSPEGNQFVAQLMDQQGYFLAELALAGSRPLRVRLPDTLRVGASYTLRVVSVRGSIQTGLTTQPFTVIDRSLTPLNIIDLQGLIHEQRSEISWLSAPESPGGRFIVQQSLPDGRFKDITTLPSRADGASSRLYTYRFTEADSVETSRWYRIRQVLPNGRISDSVPVELLTLEERMKKQDRRSRLTVYPNPGDGRTIQLRMEGVSGWLDLRLTDAAGRYILETSLPAPATGLLTVRPNTPLPNGLYIVQLRTESGPISGKLIVAN